MDNKTKIDISDISPNIIDIAPPEYKHEGLSKSQSSKGVEKDCKCKDKRLPNSFTVFEGLWLVLK
jgi:hypothetical protein